ncbi:MAG: metallophosphoesterase [Blastocatellia bacterium]
MKRTARLIQRSLLALCLSLLSSATALPQTPQPTTNLLPPALREQGQALLSEKDEKQRATLANELARKDAGGTLEFFLALLDSDPAPGVRNVILDRFGTQAKLKPALTRLAATDPDAGVAMRALEKLRAQEMRELSRLLMQRLELARQTNDSAGWNALAQEHERWISLTRGTMLPAFMRVPPVLFSLKPADKPVRLLTLGDFGQGTPAQKQVAGAMLQAQHKTPFDFALTLGDNFYPVGMESPNDPRWRTWWSELYDPLGLKFYATLGNHDWGHVDSPAAELLYERQSPSWRLPAPYYTYTAGPVQFFALDTNEVSEAQMDWLKAELAKSRARWRVVYGHHPIYSAGQHGDSATLIAKLLPVLKDRVDVYFAGHDHDLQHLKPEGGVHFFINGGGGAGIRKITAGPRSLFAHSAYGFATIEADEKQFEVKFFGVDGQLIYQYALNKTVTPPSANQN